MSVRVYAAVAVLSIAAVAQNVITTIAGTDTTFTGDGQAALTVPIGSVSGVALDYSGNIYFTDPAQFVVLRLSPSGTLKLIAGNGIPDYSGDGGPATSAAIAGAQNLVGGLPGYYANSALGGIALDKTGVIYFADGGRLRRVTPDGIINTIAGGGKTTPANGVSATAAKLGTINGVALDGAGSVYFCSLNRIWQLPASGYLTVFAGTGTAGFSGDAGPATSARMSFPTGLAFDAKGNLYVTDGDTQNYPSRLRVVSTDGKINTVAGGGSITPANGVAPLSLNLNFATGVAVDASGTLYVNAPFAGVLLKITGNTTTLLTTPGIGLYANNVPAVQGSVYSRAYYENGGVALGTNGVLIVADSGHGRLREIDASGNLDTLAGNGQYRFAGDGGRATSALLQVPNKVAVGPDGTVFVFDSNNNRIRAVGTDGTIQTVAGNGDDFSVSILNGSALATSLSLGNIHSLALDRSGNLYVAENARVLRITPDGHFTVPVNQADVFGFMGDNGPAAKATIRVVLGMGFDTAGNLYLADSPNNRIRKVDANGIITTVAGNGNFGFSGEGVSAKNSSLGHPSTILPDSSGGLYFEEYLDNPGTPMARIRHLGADGSLHTIAGSASLVGYTADGQPAAGSPLSLTFGSGLALDASGTLYIADTFNDQIRTVSPSGILGTYAGNGFVGFFGDGKPAKRAMFAYPIGLAMDAAGDLLIADTANNRIREVLASPPSIAVSPTSFAFTGEAGGAAVNSQIGLVSSPVSGLSLTFTQSPGSDWLTVFPAGGATPRLLKLTADPTDLSPGTYQATVAIQAPNASPSTLTVNVTFQVTASHVPKLASNRGSLSFTYPQDVAPRSEPVQLMNTGSGKLPFTTAVKTATGGDWLSVKPASATITPQSPVTLYVTADPTGLAPGAYAGTVTVDNSATAGDSVSITVNMTVSNLNQAILLTQRGFTVTAVAQGSVVPQLQFSVLNLGRGTLNFSVSTRTLTGGSWLQASPASGSAPAGQGGVPIVAVVNPAGLAAGTYYGSVMVSSPSAANTPQQVTICLFVLPSSANAGPAIRPAELTFTAVAGAAAPGAQQVQVYNIDAVPKSFLSNGTSGILYVPQTGTLPLSHTGIIVIQPDTDGLTPGVYEDDLTLQFSDGSVRSIRVNTVVTAGVAGASARDGASSMNGSATESVASCVPTMLIPSITSLGPSFSVPAGFPVAMQVHVQDDCGNPLNTGRVQVSFSNGDVPLSMQSLQQSGKWDGTWSTSHSTSQVMVTVSAQDPSSNLKGTREISGGLGTPTNPPMVPQGGVVSGAAFVPNTPIAPGAIVSLFGARLADATGNAGSLPLPSLLAGTSLLAGGIPMPILFSSDGQVNAVVPYGLTPNTSHQILVQRDQTLSVPVSVDVGPAQPGVFFRTVEAPMQGIIFAVRGQASFLAAPGSPATAGDVLVIYSAGLGMVTPSVMDGFAAPGSPPATTVNQPTVSVGGVSAPVQFSGLAPGFVGLYQVNAVVPSGIQPGNQVPVSITIAGQTSPPVTIAVI
jgi:uncharacterized protein (TIGR03437 family)